MNELTEKTAINLVFLAMMADRGMKPSLEQELKEFEATEQDAFNRGYNRMLFSKNDVTDIESSLGKIEKQVQAIRNHIEVGRAEGRTDVRSYLNSDLQDTFTIFRTVDTLKEYVDKVKEKQANATAILDYIYAKHDHERNISSAAFKVVRNYNPEIPVYTGDVIQAELSDGSTDTYKVMYVNTKLLSVRKQLKTKWSEKDQSLVMPGKTFKDFPQIVNFTILEKNNEAHQYVHLFAHLADPATV